MAFRFRKRIRLMPGIYLNIGKNGVSTSIGPRGANINIGKGGIYLNTGIPGTGLSNRVKLFGGKTINPNQNYTNNRQTTVDETLIKQELKTSEGLIGLKEYIEEVRKDRQELINEIKHTQENLDQLQTDLEKMKNGFFSKLFTKKETVYIITKKIEETAAYLRDITKQYEESQVDINIYFDEKIETQYKKVLTAFKQLTTSEKIWDIITEIDNNETKSAAKTTIKRQEVNFNTENIDFIKSEFPAFHFQNVNGSQIYIYPAFILAIDTKNILSLIDIKEFDFSFHAQRFLENKESIPTDTKIIDQTWAKVNKNGTPDMRFVGNYQIPIVRYGEYRLNSPDGLNESYSISNYEFAETFASEFLTYVSMLKSTQDFSATDNNSIAIITQQEFEKIKSFADKHVKLIVQLETNKSFLNTIYQSSTIKKLPYQTPEEILHYLFIFDLIKCFNLTTEIANLKLKEAFALIYTISRKIGLEINNYETNIIDEIELDYQKIYDYIKTLPSLNAHEVKPLYVKKLIGGDKFLQQLFNHDRVMGMFQGVNAGGQTLRGILRKHGATGLEDDGSFVVLFVDIMNGDTGFRFTGGNHCYMHMVAVHPFSAIGGQ